MIFSLFYGTIVGISNSSTLQDDCGCILASLPMVICFNHWAQKII